MLSFGLAAVGTYDGRTFERWDPQEHTFYRELRPISDAYQEEALEVNGLDRDRLVVEGDEPSDVMRAAADWVRSVGTSHRAVLVAYPVAFDWSFLYWYFERYAGGNSPFGHSSCLDIRTLYHGVTGLVFDRSGKQAMPEFLQPAAPHTHNALDDAVEQGELFANLLEWTIRRRHQLAHGRDGNGEPSWLASHVVPIA